MIRTDDVVSSSFRGAGKYNPTMWPEGRRIRNISEIAPMTLMSTTDTREKNQLSFCSFPFKKLRWKKVIDRCALSGCIYTKVSPRAEWKELSSIILLNEVREIQR